MRSGRPASAACISPPCQGEKRHLAHEHDDGRSPSPSEGPQVASKKSTNLVATFFFFFFGQAVYLHSMLFKHHLETSFFTDRSPFDLERLKAKGQNEVIPHQRRCSIRCSQCNSTTTTMMETTVSSMQGIFPGHQRKENCHYRYYLKHLNIK